MLDVDLPAGGREHPIDRPVAEADERPGVPAVHPHPTPDLVAVLDRVEHEYSRSPKAERNQAPVASAAAGPGSLHADGETAAAWLT